jgi:hypothetical protein
MKVYIWSVHFPAYVKRMRAMGYRHNVNYAFYRASFLTLIPKD